MIVPITLCLYELRPVIDHVTVVATLAGSTKNSAVFVVR